MLKPISGLLAVLLFIRPVLAVTPAANSDATPYREWIAHMKTAERGPFEKIAWFCKDGTILPPTPFACREHGGGRQHGVWSERTRTLRDQGYYIANILASLEPEQALADNAEQLKWILLERFLLDIDDGWILRRARHYRGAFQSESETAAARDLLKTLLAQPRYRTQHFLLLREAARLLPLHAESRALEKARNLATTIADQDPGFVQLRNKLHGFPERADAEAVRDYLARKDDPNTRESLHALLDAIQTTFERPDLIPSLHKLAASIDPNAAINGTVLLKQTAALQSADTDSERLQVLGGLLSNLRDGLTEWSTSAALQALDISIAAEQVGMATGLDLLTVAPKQTRAWQLQRLADNLHVLYGLGFITARERDAQQQALAQLPAQPSLSVYRDTLDYLTRLPAWSDAWLQYHFGPQIARFDILEPDIKLFIQDRLRASPLLVHSRILDHLGNDADRLAGVQHELLGQPVGSGFRALNPGLARGPLLSLDRVLKPRATTDKPVVLAPETIADLPPVAGILTARAGNALSHIQLLARNLGLPNVVVSADLLPRIEPLMGQRVVLLSSPGGVVQLHADDPRWDSVFPKQADKPAQISPDLDKLELDQKALLSLDQLRAKDSGRVAGPKATKLGELKHHFAGQVSQGLVIPFGVFREMLDTTSGPDGTPLFEWMRKEYRRLDAIDNTALQEQATRAFLAEVRNRILGQTLKDEFKQQLHKRMREVFGEEGRYGVFVRSDTNVEDLPGFTGAGLNLTVPNVVGFENTLEAIRNVWASPFTDRAYGWRQALMQQPEHVYASVLLHKTVPAEKSGVMITADISNNDPGIYTIATNEGIGGGVEGQAAESLKVDPQNGQTTLLASATETYKTILPVEGGVTRAVASGAPMVLSPQEVDQLIAFGQSLPERYPGLLDSEGNVAPADVEFAFTGGKLFLIQIRPFLQSQRAQRNRALLDLDEQLQRNRNLPVDLNTVPDTLPP
jgi:hypothetical protein